MSKDIPIWEKAVHPTRASTASPPRRQRWHLLQRASSLSLLWWTVHGQRWTFQTSEKRPLLLSLLWIWWQSGLLQVCILIVENPVWYNLMQGCCHFWYCHNVNNEYWCSDLIQSILFNVYITNWNLPKIHDFDKLALKLDLRKKSTTGCISIKNELCFAKFYSTVHCQIS